MNLTVQLRENTGKGPNRRLRMDGLTPGIIYGIKAPQTVSMDADKTLRFIQSMRGATKVFELSIETGSKSETKKVILQDFQLSNYGQKLIHADFLEVTDESLVHLEVPVVIINEEVCPAIKDGGVLQIIRRSIPVKCAVKDIQEFIEIDVKDLIFGQSIHVLDLQYKEGVTPVVHGRNFTILTVAGRTEEEVEKVAEGELEEVAGAEPADKEKAEE